MLCSVYRLPSLYVLSCLQVENRWHRARLREPVHSAKTQKTSSLTAQHGPSLARDALLRVQAPFALCSASFTCWRLRRDILRQQHSNFRAIGYIRVSGPSTAMDGRRRASMDGLVACPRSGYTRYAGHQNRQQLLATFAARTLWLAGSERGRYSWRSCRSNGVLLGSPPISRASFGTI